MRSMYPVGTFSLPGVVVRAAVFVRLRRIARSAVIAYFMPVTTWSADASGPARHSTAPVSALTTKTPWPMVRVAVVLPPPAGGQFAAFIGVGGVRPVLPVTEVEL